MEYTSGSDEDHAGKHKIYPDETKVYPDNQVCPDEAKNHCQELNS